MRMNHAAGRVHNGNLVVLCSGGILLDLRSSDEMYSYSPSLKHRLSDDSLRDLFLKKYFC